MKQILFALVISVSLSFVKAEEVKFKWNAEKLKCLDSEENPGLNDKYLGECGNLEGMEFTAKDLSKISLLGAEFKRSTFVNVDLSQTNLAYTKFDNSTFSQVNLSSASLIFATFNNSFFSEVQFIKTDLRASLFKMSTFNKVLIKDVLTGKVNNTGAFTRINHSTLVEVDARGADFLGVTIDRVHVDSSDFSEVKFKKSAPFTGSVISKSLFRKVEFNSTGFSYSKIRDTDFSESSFKEATFERAFVRNCNFSKSIFINVNAISADLSYANFADAKIEKSDFSGARLVKANLAGSQLVEVNLSHSNLGSATVSKLGSTLVTNAVINYETLISDEDLNFAMTNGSYYHPDARSSSVQNQYSADVEFKFDLKTQKCLNSSGAEGRNSGFVECGFVEKVNLENFNVEQGKSYNGLFLKDVIATNVLGDGGTFVGVRFEDVQIFNSSFKKALFTGASFKNVSFTDTSFLQASLDSVYAPSSWFKNVSLKGVNLAGSVLSRSVFENVDMTSAAAEAIQLESSFFGGNNQFDFADFEGGNLAYISWPSSKLSKAFLFLQKLQASNWNGSFLDGVVFDKALGAGADFGSTSATYTSFESADLSGAKFSKAKMLQSVFKNVKGAFSEWASADVRSSDFRGAKLNPSSLSTVQGEGLQFARFSKESELPISSTESLGFFMMFFVYLN